MTIKEEIEQLRSENMRMRMLLDNIDQAILTFNSSLLIDPDYTEKVQDIFEKSSLELIGISISELLFTPSDIEQKRQDEIEATLRKLFEPQVDILVSARSKDQLIEESLPVLPTECRINTGNSWKYLSIRWRWIYENDGRLSRIILIIEDETDAKELQIALGMQQERLLSLGETSANFAHEIASPTQLIGFHGEVLGKELNQLKTETLGLFDDVNDSAGLSMAKHFQTAFDKSLQVLLEMSLAQRRLRDLHEAVRNSFRQSVDVEEFSLHDILRECFVLARTRANGLFLSFECPNNIVLRSIRSQWMSVISNLIHNACDIIHEQSEKAPAALHVFVKAERHQGQLHLTVEDAGPGVPEALREKIFEKSYSTKKTGEGTGLGLPLVRRIVEAHGGAIRVDRSPQLGGALFLVTVPL